MHSQNDPSIFSFKIYVVSGQNGLTWFSGQNSKFFSTEWHKLSQWFFLHVVRLFLKIKNTFT